MKFLINRFTLRHSTPNKLLWTSIWLNVFHPFLPYKERCYKYFHVFYPTKKVMRNLSHGKPWFVLNTYNLFKIQFIGMFLFNILVFNVFYEKNPKKYLLSSSLFFRLLGKMQISLVKYMLQYKVQLELIFLTV